MAWEGHCVRLVENLEFLSSFPLLMFKFLDCGLGLCGRLKNASLCPTSLRDTSIRIPGLCKYDKSIFADVDWVKDFEMRLFGLSWGGGAKSHYQCPNKREAEGDLSTDRRGVGLWPQRQRLATEQGLLQPPETGSGKERIFLGPVEEMWLCQHFNFSPVKLEMDIWPLDWVNSCCFRPPRLWWFVT